MLNRLFDPEAPLWRTVSNVADAMFLSLLWLFLSLPLVTLGAATAALYDATLKCVRGTEPSAVLRFFRTFRRELRASLLPSLIWVLLLFLSLLFLRFLLLAADLEAVGAPVLVGLYLVVLLIPLGAFCWTFPMLSRFTFNTAGLFRTAFQVAVIHLPYTLLIVVLAAAAALVSRMFLFPMFFMPCVAVLLWSFPMERTFKKYTP